MVLGKVLGNISWATKAVKYGQAHLRDLRVLYITESRRLKGNLQQLTSLSQGANKVLLWLSAKTVFESGHSMVDLGLVPTLIL